MAYISVKRVARNKLVGWPYRGQNLMHRVASFYTCLKKQKKEYCVHFYEKCTRYERVWCWEFSLSEIREWQGVDVILLHFKIPTYHLRIVMATKTFV